MNRHERRSAKHKNILRVHLPDEPFMKVEKLTQPQLNALLANCAASAALISIASSDQPSSQKMAAAMGQIKESLDACAETGVFEESTIQGTDN